VSAIPVSERQGELTAFLERFDHYCDLKRQLRAVPDGEESRLLIGMLVDEWPRLEELRERLAPIHRSTGEA
jgi:hypothetical protein